MEDSDLEEILEEDFWRISFSKKVKHQGKANYQATSNTNE